jgi:hypothetical protein
VPTAVETTTYSNEVASAPAPAYSSPYTDALLLIVTTSKLDPFDDDWNDTAGSFRNLDGDSLALRQSRYRIRLPVPKVRTGKCYRIDWVERFVPEAGAGLTSAAVFERGVYRPTVTVTGDGTGCEMVAVMSSGGGVSSLRVLNPGSGYTTATITVQTAVNGGTTSTGWTATVANGQVTAATGGSAGDYLPTGAITGDGTSAAITFTLDDTGGIASASTTAGSGYTSMTLTITPKVSGSVAADVLLLFGTETAKCAEWDGTTLAGRWVSRLPIAAGGDPLTSIEVVHGGNYLPIVSFSGGNGTGAAATAAMSADGKITSITVTNGGSGYTGTPSVTVIRRGSGGSVTAATATATVSGGVVTGVTVVTQGNYLPTLTISGGGGSGATATVAMSTSGAIASVALTDPGSGYLTNPTLTLSYYGTETVLLAAHFGTEAEYADGTEPPGAVPVGYVDGVVRTYPVLGDTGTAPWKYFELPVPTADGTTTVQNVRAVCDCAPCP